MEFKAAEQFQMSSSLKDAGNTAASQHWERTGLILNYGFKYPQTTSFEDAV